MDSSACSWKLNDWYPSGTNNGKISSQYDAISGETVTYTYDTLNRLLSASSSGWTDTYAYDGLGNLTTKTPTGGAPQLSISVSATTNQIQGVSGLSYDNNGNELYGGVAYDAENRVLTVLGVQYAYDSRHKRIWKGTFSGSTLTAQEAYFYGVDGQKLGTYSLTLNGSQLTAATTQTAVFFGGKRVAVNGVAFAPDRLGSNTAGKYFPYGEDRGTPIANDQVKFATYTRDSATGLDYADQRYYTNQFGRFMSPDPYNAGAGASDPGSWNRYSYVQGDPVNYTDRTGLNRDAEDCIDDPDACEADDWSGFGGLAGVGNAGGVDVSGGIAYRIAFWENQLSSVGIYSTAGPGGTLDISLSTDEFSQIFGMLPVAIGAGAGAGEILLDGIAIGGITISGGTVILVGAGIALGAEIWQVLYQRSRQKTWDVTCHFHVIGTENHESEIRLKTTVVAATRADAYVLAQQACNQMGWQQLGASGWHLQHVSVRENP